MRAVLIVVAVAGVLVEIEISIRSRIDPQFDRSCRLLVRVLDFRTKRKNRTGTHVEWNAIERGVRVDFAASFVRAPVQKSYQAGESGRYKVL